MKQGRRGDLPEQGKKRKPGQKGRWHRSLSCTAPPGFGEGTSAPPLAPGLTRSVLQPLVLGFSRERELGEQYLFLIGRQIF